MIRCLRGRGPTQGTLASPGYECFLVEGDERGNERTGIADHHRLADQWVRSNPILQRRRRHVLPGASDDQLLLPSSDTQIAIVVKITDVAGLEPSIGVEDIRCGLLIAPVSLEDLRTFGKYLAIGGDTNARAHQRPAHGAWFPCAKPVDRQGSGSFP